MKITELSKETGSIGGSALSAFCPACVPAVGSFFTAIGLGSLVNFKLLGYLTIIFLILGVVGLYLNSKNHKIKYFLIVGILASIGVYVGRYLTESLPIIYLSAVILIGNAIFDYRAVKKCKKCKV